jgi:plasmid stability protein
MAQVVVRNLEDSVKLALKRRATAHGWSMEEEARRILRLAVAADSPAATALGSRITARFAGQGLVQDLPELHGQAITAMDLGA